MMLPKPYTIRISRVHIIAASSFALILTVLPTATFSQAKLDQDTKLQDVGDARTKWGQSLKYGKALVKHRPLGEMIQMDFEILPRRLRSEVASYIRIPVRNEAEPFDSAPPAHFKKGIGAQVAVFAARDNVENDLVRCAWRYLDKQVAVTMSINARRFDFALHEVANCAENRGATCVSAIRTWVESVLLLNGIDRFDCTFRVELPWPDELSDETYFSSAPELDIQNVIRWHLRVDAEVREGMLSIYVYKKIPQLQGGYLDGSKWFDDEFRAFVHQKACDQDKVWKELEPIREK